MRWAFACIALIAAASCTLGGAGAEARERWTEAERLWRERDDAAFAAWQALDPRSPEARAASLRLARADALYRAGLGAFRDGSVDTARERFVQAAALAPVDPLHYLALARIYRDRGMPESAAKYYRKYLRAASVHAARGDAEHELAALELGPTEVLDPPAPAPAESGLRTLLPIALGALLPGVLALSLWLARRRGDARERRLSSLIAGHPELHPAIAYLIGSLRHELLKHRVAAVSDAVARLARGERDAAESAFVRARLLGIGEAFREHRAAFARELGHLLELAADPAFAQAERAVLELERALARGDDAAAQKQLAAAHGRLLAFDAELAALQQRLVRTRIDVALLREVVRQTYAEAGVRSAAIDDLECRGDGLPVEVEVLRSDLLLIIRNLLRNAVLAASRGDSPRLVRLVLSVDLEPTGLEVVCLAVQDSSAEPLTAEHVAASGLGGGLGLASAAVRRYGGSLAIEPSAAPMRKQVCVRFMRAYGGATVQGAA